MPRLGGATSGKVTNKDGSSVSEIVKKFSGNDFEDVGTALYIGKESATGEWWLKKVDTSVDGALPTGHASVTNNPAITSYTSAWTNRATLTYGDFTGAF